ncbi:TonB-dependent receptor [Bowmanella denitrificans]|uniref:TonB-dependent receptor n=1 Tax=Bowmanella denitrificans TaxID=366582 RepID=UPI000C9CCA37|nr:TonB-dependent receptor [Bowmanella denitrificans]
MDLSWWYQHLRGQYVMQRQLLILTALSMVGATAAAQQSDDALEHIKIRGIRSSLLEAINSKKETSNFIDAISAENIGKFPDKNVAESLQRLTGVSLYRVMGEGERIGVRGTAPSQNLTLLNGQSIASSDWWISSQPSRGFNYTMIPSELVESLEVNKSPQADLDEGSLGGAVVLNTPKPLDTESGKMMLKAQLQYTDLADKWAPQFSALYNWRDDGGDLGLLMALVKHRRNLRRDGLEAWGWAERNFSTQADGSLRQVEAENADIQGLWTPGGGGSALFQQARDLTSSLLSGQWRVSKDTELTLNLLYSVLDADNSNQNFLWLPSNSYQANGLISDVRIQDQSLLAATYHALPDEAFNTSMEAIWRNSRIDQKSAQLYLKHYFGYWRADLQAGITASGGDTSADSTSQWSANSSYRVDTSAERDIRVSYDLSPLNGDNWFISEVRQDASYSQDQERYLQMDLARSMDHPILAELSFGLKYKDHGRELQRLRTRNGGYDGLAGDLDWRISDFSGHFPSGYLGGVGSQHSLKAFAFVDIDALSAAYRALPFVISEEQQSRFVIDEQVTAGYLKLNLKGRDYRGDLGMRLVHTNQRSAGYQQQTDDMSDAVWISRERSYTDILPSLNLAIDLHEDLVLRAAAAKVMARPDYEHIMPSVNYNKTQAQGVAGNPQLDPFRATQFDLGLEWYWQEASLASVALFYKNVRSFVDISRFLEVHEGIEMSIDRPLNGPGGTIKGLELGLQHEFIYGLGLIANYTLVDGERDSGAPGQTLSEIPGNSRHTFNVSGYYEDELLSARLSYNYRTRYATGLGEARADNTGQLDMNLTLHISKNWDLLLEAINLTDEVLFSYDRVRTAPIGIYKNGRRFYVGASYRF